MTQKNASPTKKQSQVIARNGLNRLLWVVIKERNNILIIKNRLTGEIKVIGK